MTEGTKSDNIIKEPALRREHVITYGPQAEFWYCKICGARGLDGEHSPREVECLKLISE